MYVTSFIWLRIKKRVEIINAKFRKNDSKMRKYRFLIKKSETVPLYSGQD